MATQQQLSFGKELLETADAIRRIRSRLYELIRAGKWPEGSCPDISTVLVSGLDVADSLQRLADESPPRTPGPYDPSERR